MPNILNVDRLARLVDDMDAALDFGSLPWDWSPAR